MRTLSLLPNLGWIEILVIFALFVFFLGGIAIFLRMVRSAAAQGARDARPGMNAESLDDAREDDRG